MTLALIIVVAFALVLAVALYYKTKSKLNQRVADDALVNLRASESVNNRARTFNDELHNVQVKNRENIIKQTSPSAIDNSNAFADSWLSDSTCTDGSSSSDCSIAD